MTSERPLPVRDAVNAAYWDGAREHRLMLLRCTDCEFWIHPPRPTCPHCQSEQVEATQASGKGVIYSFSIMHRAGNPGFDEQVPFAVVVVELAEQAGLITIGNMPDCPMEEIEIGMAVQVTYEDLGEVTLPQWQRADGAAAGESA